MTESDTTYQLPATTDSASTPRGKRLWPLWALTLLTLMAVLALSAWNWVQWQDRQQLQQRVGQLTDTTDRLDRQSSRAGDRLRGEVQSLREQLNQQQQTLSEQARQIDHNAQALLDAGNRTRTDWLLAEAEYLLRIGNQRLQIENDYEGAMAALQSADEVLASTDDPGVFPVRKAVAREIMALKSIETVDRTGLYLTLEAAIDTVSDLTEQALTRDIDVDGETLTLSQSGDDARDSSQSALSQGWRQLLASLDDAITIRRMDETVKPLLSPQQSAYARLNLRLMLEEAELAVLRGNQTLYERALGKADTWLNNWYDDTHAPVRALQKTLDELQSRDINPELPDISRSLSLLKARLEGRLSTNRDGEADSNGDSDNKTGESS
ncbi:uroporphyrin-3 C-methyltransferase [Tamilnaduibacter salinus]|uniref:Uroporphyrin-3 C-methyltransferase n=1 Tax=Tamilnaduibacter salinus TaxID=1484056 RepID=A0A2U1CXE9_9GAMM|nr:uroporphyrinogen-III C-methyltransferase [Tamilnaduibacter salinus]PVY76922.1 uroporphyrin-3 C-methyltransferase [Tamilnaduibacter salinus]